MRDLIELTALDEAPGPAKVITARHAARILDGALAAQARRVAVPWMRPLAIAAAIVLVCGGVASGAYVVRRWRVNATAAADLAARGSWRVSPERPRAARAATIATPPSADGQSLAGVEATDDRDPAVASVVTLHSRDRGGRGNTRSASRAALASSSQATRTDLLQSANVLRAQSRWHDAERVYRQVAALAPGSNEAYAASVAAAALRLERLGDAAGALTLYRRAVGARPRGALAEEARWGVAQACRAIGDSAGELAALRAFIAAHPASLRRPTAESRLTAASLRPVTSPF